MRIRKLRTGCLILILLLVAAWAVWVRVRDLLREPQFDLNTPVRIEIPAGAGLGQVITVLRDAGLLQRPWLLQMLFRWYRTDRHIKAGLYEFHGRMDTWQLYRRLLEGQVLEREIRIVEGWDRFEIADYLEAQGIAPRRATLEALRSPRFVQMVRDLDPHAGDLEGYLFPSTYRIAEPVTLEKVLTRLVQTFRRQWQGSRETRARELGINVRKVIILASLVEKETGRDEERPRVAAVFLNRLQRRMRLECDPTVIYAWRLRGRTPVPLTYADLDIDSPYNTYRYEGLPPGPIANPGLKSIDAVLHPDPGGWLYFVADGRGGHRFARTFREHRANVRKYRHQQKNQK